MNRIITVPFTEDFIDHLADYIHKEYLLKGKDLRRLALVFGGHRPFLFLKRALAKRLQTSFYPPQFFTIDEWMNQIVQGHKPFLPLPELDHNYLIYQLAQKHTPALLKGRERFASFLPWAREILALIEQLDLESTSEEVLKNLQAEAQIGFDVPEDISRLLESLFVLRKAYHQELEDRNIAARGYQYHLASQLIDQTDLSHWNEILFCNFFYLHRSEMKVVEYCFRNANATLMIQGDQRRWPALKRIAAVLGQDIFEGPQVIEGTFKLSLHAAFDTHSQAAMVEKILKEIKNPDQTVIVLPQPDFILPLVSALASQVKEFNISMGYPLRRSALFTLLERIFTAQKSKRGKLYYTRDYLRVLRHPLVKNLSLSESHINGALIHRIEDLLTGQIPCVFSGHVYLDLDAFMNEQALYEDAGSEPVRVDELKKMIGELHEFLFISWQKTDTFQSLATSLGSFAELMRSKSQMAEYPFNEHIALHMENMAHELGLAAFASQTFEPLEMFRILEQTLGRQMVAFSGSPLRGLQILGLFETRALSFDNVIVVDVNEGVLPNLNIYEPLIPRDIMIKLNLDRLELEEEIQRYGFMRLISSAKTVHLIYQDRPERERSRFIEELIWNEEKKSKEIGIVPIERGRFNVHPFQKEKYAPKTPAIIEHLKNLSFSASSLNTYLRNPYEFYENYVLGLREQDNLLDEPEAKQIGTFVHNFLEDVFKGFVNKKPILDEEFKRYFFKLMQSNFEETFGRQQRTDTFLMKNVLETRFERFYEAEAARCRKEVQSVMCVERKFQQTVAFKSKEIKLTYRIDRIDKLEDDSILIIDYKTGSKELIPRNLHELLEESLSRELLRDTLLSFQMPLYLDCLSRMYPGSSINAATYNLRTNVIEKFIKNNNKELCEQGIEVGLKALDFITDEILDINIPFLEDTGRVET